jgi:hypothetical protein
MYGLFIFDYTLYSFIITSIFIKLVNLSFRPAQEQEVLITLHSNCLGINYYHFYDMM